MSEFGGDHARIAAVFLHRSRQYLAGGSLLQASEKGWGAAAHAAKLIAGARGWPYRMHREFNSVVIPRLAAETGQNSARSWGESANRLHRNFYNDDMDALQIAAHLDNVANLVNLIRQAVGLPPIHY